jgi:AcrR family transcriptional regulator
MDSAAQLFATHGYRGAPVRDICNLARANPGAVSYHFGGKRQLYRAVLRQAAERLAAVAQEEPNNSGSGVDAIAVARRVARRILNDPVAARLLLRDLADGGTIAVEALEPSLRSAVDALARAAGGADTPAATAQGRTLFLDLASPIFLITVAWPVVARPLGLQDAERERLLDAMLRSQLDKPTQGPGTAE